jgi:uncharacterized protein YqgQ
MTTTITRSTDSDDMQRAIDAMREAVVYIRKRDYGGALMQSELATLLIRIVASKHRKE